MKKKTNNPTPKKRRRANLADRYQDIFTLRQNPLPEAVVRRIFDEALSDICSDNTEILKLSSYFRKKGITMSTIERYAKKYEWAARKYDEMKRAVGDNREIGALKKKYDSKMVMFTQPLYDPCWEKLYEQHASWNNKESASGSTVVVKMDSFEDGSVNDHDKSE